MVTFQTPGGAPTYALPVLRVEPSQCFSVCIQSPRPLWVATHWKDRELLCAGPECSACSHLPRRVKAFLVGVLATDRGRHAVLLEVPQTSMAKLLGMLTMEQWEFEPGLVVEVRRAKPRSPLRLEPVGPGGEVFPELRAEVRLMQAFACLFSLPLPADVDTIETWSPSLRGVVMARLAAAGL